MTRPIPTPLFHFTAIDHVATILRDGLVCDAAVGPRLLREAGNVDIKTNRRSIQVQASPHGVVADYVPFYFAPRSPMMFSISKGNVPTYGSDTSALVYVVTSVELLCEHRCSLVFSRHNAASATADFFADQGKLDDYIDWPLMQERYWRNTDDDHRRRDRRMAECLGHGRVPAAAFEHFVVRTPAVAQAAREILASVQFERPVLVEPDWYF